VGKKYIIGGKENSNGVGKIYIIGGKKTYNRWERNI
jgi:hypothetical protein